MWWRLVNWSLLFFVLSESNSIPFALASFVTIRTHRSISTITTSLLHSTFYSNQNQNHLHTTYEQAGGILYKKSVLTPSEYDTITSELSSLILTEEATSSIAKHRLGAPIPLDSIIVRILGDVDGSLSRLVNRVCATEKDDGSRMILSSIVPVEMRVYEKKGAGMDWHIDDVLYEPKQVEVILTLQNDSDCVTMWQPHSKKGGPVVVEEVETEPNSAILLRAGGVKHKVSPLKRGRRVILKLAYVHSDAAILVDGHHVHQFASKRGKGNNHNRKKGRRR